MNAWTSTSALLLFAVSVLLPLVVGLVTTNVTSPHLKAILLLLFTAINGFLNQWISQGSDFQWRAAVVSWIFSYVTALALHYGYLKPSGVTAKVQSMFVKAA